MQTYDPHKSTVEVRQGDRRSNTTWILVVSTIVAVVVLALVFWWFAVYNPGLSANNHY
ncbi:MAG TPA: hypothetical protein VHB74_01835 [Devosia sp.]|nr:hypothetical protein [Devosia sp.]